VPLRREGAAALAFLAASACGGAAVSPPAVAPLPVAEPVVAEPAVEASAVAPPVDAGPLGTGVWAVVIGIDDYAGTGDDLQDAVADADTVVAALDLAGVPVEQRVVLRGADATAAAITDALGWLVAHAGPASTAVVAYAGHALDRSRTTQAIVAADGVELTDAALAADLAGLRASATWLLWASCSGGGFDELLAPGRILTAAAGPGGVARETSRFGRSYLVEYLVHRAWLQGRAGSSVQEAAAWASATLAAESPADAPWVVDRTVGPVVLGPLGAPYVSPPPTTTLPVPLSPPPPPPPVTPPAPAAPPPNGGHTCSGLGALRVCS
jgi:hypothetical protein